MFSGRQSRSLLVSQGHSSLPEGLDTDSTSAGLCSPNGLFSSFRSQSVNPTAPSTTFKAPHKIVPFQLAFSGQNSCKDQIPILTTAKQGREEARLRRPFTVTLPTLAQSSALASKESNRRDGRGLKSRERKIKHKRKGEKSPKYSLFRKYQS